MSVINKINKNYKRSQKGRSMVEMLGVLAIVGVLSVGGVYGYGVAMKKHKANELLHQASMLATTISAQIQSKGQLPQNIENFGDAKYGTFNPPSEANAEQFEMKITGMDSAVCEQMEKMSGGMVRKAECDGSTLTLTYNNNLSSDKVAADYNDDATGEECTDAGYKWCGGECKKDCCSGVTLNSCQESCDSSTGEITNKEDGTDCTTADGKEGTCNAGECEEATADYTGVKCSNNSECGGNGSGYYCEYDCVFEGGNGYCENEGVCKEALGETEIAGYLSSTNKLSWSNANNWCIAKDKDGLITYNTLKNKYSCDIDRGTCNFAQMREDNLPVFFWTNPSSHMLVDLQDDSFTTGADLAQESLFLCE